MNKKSKVFNDIEKSIGYNAYVSYQKILGRSFSEDKFKQFRYKKYFFELAKQFLDNNTTIPLEDYIKYIIDNKVPATKWSSLTTFRNFLLLYVKEEPKDSAISRSIKFLSDKGLNISTISDNRLILYLESGSISPWLVLKEYPEFFEEINKQQGNVFCRNILNYYFWKLKISEL